MKRQILTAFAALALLPAAAQTNFRSITYDEAITVAKNENKLVFMDFYTDWCGPCKMMMRDVFPQKHVGDYMNEHFVCIKLNAEKEGKDLAKLYNVKAYPTFVAIDTNKNVVMTKVGGSSADAFVADIDRLIDPEKTPERLKARYESGERTPELISAYASLLMSEANERNEKAKQEEAFKMVHDYFNGLSDADRLADDNLFIYKMYTTSPADETARFMVAHRNDFSKQVKKEIDETIATLYKQQLYGYFCGYQPYDATTYELTKKDVNELGLNDDKKYDACFRFIECHATGDLNAYLDLCEKDYDTLPEELQSTLMTSFATLIQTDDEAVRQRASKFVRSKLANMPINTLLFTAYQLMDLEGKGHH